MQRMFLKISSIALLTNLAAFGQSPSQPQSLGDVARQFRQKQDADEASGKEPKVFTNKDLPANPPGYQPPREQPDDRPIRSADMARAFGEPPSGERSFGNRSLADRTQEQGFGQQQRGPEQWRQAIQVQESRLANLQERINQLNTAIRSRGGTAEYDGPFNRNQGRQLQHVAQMQQILEEQRRRLDQMQDAARRAGMHTSVYDP